MMVAYDPRRTPTPLSEATREAIRVAIVESLQDGGEARDSLRAALRTAAEEARQREMRPEELIIGLKSIFSAALHTRTGSVPVDENRLREWLVTSCLKAFYGEQRP